MFQHTAMRVLLFMLDPSAGPTTNGGSGGADIPNPGFGNQPPGTGGALTILTWVAWGVCVLCVGGFVGCAGQMAMFWRRHEAGQHATSVGTVALACVLLGAASALVGALHT